LSNSTFDNVGFDKRNKSQSAISIYGVQLANMDSLKFKQSRKLNMHLVVGDPVINLRNITFEDSEGIQSNSEAYHAEGIVEKPRNK